MTGIMLLSGFVIAMFWKLWRKKNANSEKRSPVSGSDFAFVLESESDGFRWCGVHPCAPYATYQIVVRDNFQKILRDATHELEIKLKTPSEVRILYRLQSDFRVPFMANDNVAEKLKDRLVRLLLEEPNPRKVPGMYSLLYEGEQSECPWSKAISRYRSDLIRQSLKRNGMTYEQYAEDPKMYNSLGKVRAEK